MTPGVIPPFTNDASRTKAGIRFWAKVSKGDGCWEWTGRRNTGYGVFLLAGKVRKAHRVAWVLAHGSLKDSIRVLHRCDNPCCVRIDHLFLGTQTDNIRDMLAKGRHRVPRGSAKRLAKLKEADVIAIFTHPRRRHAAAELAAQYGVSPVTIGNIFYRKAWKHITEGLSHG